MQSLVRIQQYKTWMHKARKLKTVAHKPTYKCFYSQFTVLKLQGYKLHAFSFVGQTDFLLHTYKDSLV